MSATRPQDVVRQLLADPTNPDVVDALVAPDATYVSLSDDNPELKRIMPWAGTAKGPGAVLDAYRRVGRYWKNEGFAVEDVLETGGTVAVFGRFTYRSVTLGKAVTSPFAILARVAGGRIVFMQFMEDTFGTAATFRSGGTWTFHSDPDGPPVTV